MSADVAIQMRKYRPAFLGAALVLLVFGIPPLVWTSVEGIEITGVLAQLLAWCFAVALAAYEVFRYLNHADDHLLLSSPLGARDGVLPRVIALGAWLAVLSLISLTLWRVAQWHDGISVSVVEVAYYVGTRAVSFIAFFAVTMVLSTYSKIIRQRSLALLVVAVTTLALTVGLAMLALTVTRTSHPDHVWALGIDTNFHGLNQYVMALPIVFRPETLSRVSETVLPASLVLNVAISLAAVVLWRWPLRRMRLNFV